LKLSSRGIKLLVIQLLLAASTLIYRDILLLTATLLTSSATILSAYVVVKAGRWAGKLECEPRNVKLKMMAGEEKNLTLYIYTPFDLKLANLPDWLKTSKNTLERGVNEVGLTISPKIGKPYRLDYLAVVFADPLKILYTDFRVALGLEVMAYPRVLPFLVEALSMAGQTGYGGEKASVRKGRGTEYLWSREYQLGDPLTSIDWKASARHEKIIVKEFSEELYGAIGVVFDVRAVGPVNSDEINALFLLSIISVARHSIPITLILKNGLSLISEYPSIDPDTALKIAISYTVKNYITNGWDVYELLEPKTAGKVLSMLREVENSGLLEALQLKMKTLNEVISRLTLKEAVVYYVGNIVVDSEFVLELSTRVKVNNGELVVLTSGKPWKDLDSLEQAYIMYLSHVKILNILQQNGSTLIFYKEPLTKTRETTIPQ
jgi:hypothetical protein